MVAVLVHPCDMAHASNLPIATCTTCGSTVLILNRFRDYSTTRGPMNEYLITRCDHCGQQHLLHAAAQSASAQG